MSLNRRRVLQAMETLVALNSSVDGGSTYTIRQQTVKENKGDQIASLSPCYCKRCGVTAFCICTHLHDDKVYESLRNKIKFSFLLETGKTKQIDKTARSPNWPILLPKYIKGGRGQGRERECTTPLSDFHLLRFTFLNLHFIFHPGRLATFHINCMVPFRHSPSVFVLFFVLLFLRRILNDITDVI